MLLDRNTKPMQIVAHKDFSRASWLARAGGADTPLDSMLRNSRDLTVLVLSRIGL